MHEFISVQDGRLQQTAPYLGKWRSWHAVSFCSCMESDGSHVPCTAGLTRRKFVKASPLPPSSPQQEVPELGKVPSCMCIASLPDHSHLQYLIAYSMQIQREKAWEIWTHVVMSGKQRVDTRGWCPTRLEALSCTIGPRAGGKSVSKAVSIPSLVHCARDGLTRKGNYYCRAPPPVCLPSVYLT